MLVPGTLMIVRLVLLLLFEDCAGCDWEDVAPITVFLTVMPFLVREKIGVVARFTLGAIVFSNLVELFKCNNDECCGF